MSAPTRPSSDREPPEPRRQSGGRPVRVRNPLSPGQMQVLAVGAALLLTLLYLLAVRGSREPVERIEDGAAIRVELREFAMNPQNVSVAQGNVEIYATNRGSQVHNLQVETIVSRSTDERATPLLKIDAMQPGQTKSASATLSPGRYRWRSSIANDDDLGMYGVIEVRP